MVLPLPLVLLLPPLVPWSSLPSIRLRLLPPPSVSSGPSLRLDLAAGSDLPGEAASALTGAGEGARERARAGGGRGDGGAGVALPGLSVFFQSSSLRPRRRRRRPEVAPDGCLRA